ncbi:MAG: cell division protein FtsZ [Candidatus Methanoperedens sp.]|nr:cell division protein FtsZ [Candidatus Methanoperedens sp.]MCZ7404681.1 cell division protein FtsZ [Candidatus Methanoperedens sp.]
MLNVLIIGVGQCGNRILDAINKEAFGGSVLSKYYGTQKFTSRVETLAINTAMNDLKELRFTRAKDRIHVPYLHGVGANRNIGKQCFEDNKELLLRSIEERGDFDVAFVIASSSGGTGSSFTPLLIEALKERYKFSVYGIIVLPFREEGSIYLQNSIFCLKEIIAGSSDGNIIVDNQFLKHLGKDIKTAYDGINRTVAQRFLFLLKALDSEMMMVTDLGDFKTVMSAGSKLATMGFGEGDKNMPVKAVIKHSLSHAGLLFELDPYKEANRAMIIIEGDKKYLNINDITTEVEKLSGEIGQIFKGVLLRNGEMPRVLTVLSIGASSELNKLFNIGIEAVRKEKEKKEQVAEQNRGIKEKLEGLEPQY